MSIILASSSPYRRRLLERLQLPFRCESPGIDEAGLPGETAADKARRLALEKAAAVASRYPGALVIGSDQVATDEGRIIGKPGNFHAAREQLRASSGRSLCFYTGLALVCRERGLEDVRTEPFRVYFRHLEESAIERYLQRDEPYDCAGSFKWESLGIALFDRMEGDDPTSLEGLPLITLTSMLEQAGCPVLGPR